LNDLSVDRSPSNRHEEKSSDSPRLSKAQAVVDSQGVKLHRFLPSGRTIWTVVGRECDFLVDIDPEDETKLYCACSDFYYRVLSTKVSECYHLLAYKIALKQELYVTVNFSDEEYPQFLRALVADDFKAITSRKAGKEEPLP